MAGENSGLSSSVTDHQVSFEPVKQHVRSAVDKGTVIGVALAVVHRGQIVWEEGFGYADREQQIPSSPNMPYSTASITKAFTATLVTALSESYQFSLDSSVTPYLQASPLQGQNGDPDAVTIRMLGAHCSGLPGTFAAHLADNSAPAQSTTAFLNDYGRLAYPAGQIYEYGNIGFGALGAMVENLTGQKFGIVMDERILKPLELRDSFFSNAVDRISSAAIGYDDDAKRIPLYSTSTPPSGELYASAHDLARFALFNLNEDGTKSVLSSAGINELRAPVFRGPQGISSTFGWYTGKLTNGEPYFFKGGGQPGVAAKIFFVPSLELGCVVLTNRTDNMPFVEKCCELILRNYVPDFAVPEEDAGPTASAFVPTTDIIGSWQGSLLNGGANQSVRFNMNEDGTATFALSDRPSEPVNEIKQYTPGFEGTTTGLVDCEHADVFGTRTLVLRLVPLQGKLIGRVTARGTRPGLLLANTPYVLTLERS